MRNLHFIMQKYPSVMQKEFKHFFCKYGEPLYVKFEKMSLMIRLAENSNYELIIDEFTQYSSDIDVDFSQKALEAIWKVGLKINLAFEK